jgi:putative hydrolase of the HAD superfamily
MLFAPLDGPPSQVTTLFLDIGGVLLTNGWGRQSRRKAAETFNIDYAEMDERHHLSFNTYEDGKLTLDQYLDQVVFFEPRSFTRQQFRDFMFAQSQPFPEMLSLIRSVKEKNRIRIVLVSNEGRELTIHRVKAFGLTEFVDAFIVSCFVHYRKPDRDIYALALDVAQARPDQVLYVDDRALFVQIASDMGINSIVHTNYESTRRALESVGLTVPEQAAALQA